MRRLLLPPLFVLLLGMQAEALSTGRDSLSRNFDEWLNKFPENYFSNFHPSASPVFDQLVSPFRVSSSPADVRNFSFGIPAYSSFFIPENVLPSTPFRRPSSRIDLILGAKREQQLIIQHKQRIGSFMRLGLQYRSMLSPGYFNQQFSKHKAFALSPELYFGRSLSRIDYHYRKISAEQSGGLNDSIQPNGKPVTDLLTLPVQLSDANREQNLHDAKLSQRFYLGKLAFDTLSRRSGIVPFAEVVAGFRQQGWLFESSADSGYFDNFYQSSESTFDTCSFREAYLKGGLQWFGRFADSSWNWSGRADYQYNKIQLKQYEKLNDEREIQSVSIEARAFSENTRYRFQMSRVMAGFSEGALSLFADAFFRPVGSPFVNSFLLSVLHEKTEPLPFYQFYSSNHFKWNNNFNKVKRLEFRLQSEFWQNRVRLDLLSELHDDFIYVNQEAVPEQSRENFMTYSAKLGFTEEWKKFHFQIEAEIWESSSEVYRKSPLQLNTRLAYRNRFFTRNLYFETGIGLTYAQGYRMNRWMPATGLFYLQDNWTSPDYPQANAFLNLGIGTATLWFRLDHLNYGWSSQEAYLDPVYFRPPRILKFGLTWMLKD